MELNKLNVDELKSQELLSIEGGSEISDSFCRFVGRVVRGFEVFATEGGNNAGLCVR